MQPFPRNAYKKVYREVQYLGLLFLVLSLVTLFTYLDPEVDQKFEASSLQSINEENVTLRPTLIRAPASVKETDLLSINKEFFCKTTQDIVQDKIIKNLVMINFKLCYDLKSINTINTMDLENESNGFKAQIFKIDHDQFKTDYIQLNNGLNKLKFEVILKNGQKIKESLEILSGS